MYSWEEKFKSGEYIDEYNGYTPYYIGCFYGAKVCLGGEDEFMSCTGFFSGIADIEWWDTKELKKLTSEQIIKLNSILKRNKLIDEYIESNMDVFYSIFGKDYRSNIHRKSNIDKIRFLWLFESVKGENKFIKYCVDNKISNLDLSEEFNHQLKNETLTWLKIKSLEETNKLMNFVNESTNKEFYNKLFENND